jgi:phosphatidylinositol-4,5-bisphosphate 3-kinase
MEEYLLHAGVHSQQLFVQNALLKRLELIAEKIQNAKRSMSSDQCKRLFHKELDALNKDLPDVAIQIPLNPKWSAKKIIVERCRYMSSKKVPLWLVFENADEYAPPIEIMFKSGDDLRQDMLTLQIITIMDRLWLDNKLDLHLKPYSVLATGVNRHNEGVGMLELVLNSSTVNTINVEYGGAFNEKTIDSYLRKYNTYEVSLSQARDSFARSCAGYCVATCVLGVGDRHSDNYMVTKNGQFFHIDFGHFLGNFKSKFGFRRERSPFVFTPQMKFAIDAGQRKNKTYAEFLGWCAEAYNILRVRSRLLLVLFVLMVSAEMPELMKESDILYFRQMLNLKYDTKKASTHVHKQISSALKDKTRLMDNAIHLKVHL